MVINSSFKIRIEIFKSGLNLNLRSGLPPLGKIIQVSIILNLANKKWFQIWHDFPTVHTNLHGFKPIFKDHTTFAYSCMISRFGTNILADNCSSCLTYKKVESWKMIRFRLDFRKRTFYLKNGLPVHNVFFIRALYFNYLKEYSSNVMIQFSVTDNSYFFTIW